MQRKNGYEEEKHCEVCGKPLFGRSDKRFCNDTCRNAWNREKAEREKQKANENLPEIFRIIRKNYEILSEQAKESITDGSECFLELETLIQQGFNPKFFTSIALENNTIYRCCFERAWHVKDKHIFIKDIPYQAKITWDNNCLTPTYLT